MHDKSPIDPRVANMLKGAAQQAVDPNHRALKAQAVRDKLAAADELAAAHNALLDRVSEVVTVLAPDLTRAARDATLFASMLRVVVSRAGGRLVLRLSEHREVKDGVLNLREDVVDGEKAMVLELVSAANHAAASTSLVGPDGKPVG